MTRTLLLLMLFILPAQAYAQSVTCPQPPNWVGTWPSYQTTGNPGDIRTSTEVGNTIGQAVKADNGTALNLTVCNPSITNGTATNTTIAGAPEVGARGRISSGSYVTSAYHVVPDFYIQSTDNGDDALAINRAIQSCKTVSNRCEVDFLSRLYKLNTGVVATEAQVILKGMGTQERTSQISGTNTVTPWGGTWLQVSATGFVPVTLGGYGGGGSEVRDLGIYEVQPAPVDGQAWTPTAYGPFFSSTGSLLPVRYHNIDMLGITRGIYSDGDQRLEIDNIRGQVFQYGISLHHVYDAPSINSLHFWPYWSQSVPVLAYQQANADATVLGRVDGAFIDRVFCFGCRAAYHLTNDGVGPGGIPGGPATKIMTGSTYCDFAYACIYADSAAANFDISALYMTFQGQQWNPATAAVPLSGASAFNIQGYGNLNIHELYTQYTQQNIGVLANGSAGSYVNIGAMRADVSNQSDNSWLFGAVKPTAGTDVVTLGTLPLILGQRPSGLTVFQSGSSLTVVQPQTQTVASGAAP